MIDLKFKDPNQSFLSSLIHQFFFNHKQLFIKQKQIMRKVTNYLWMFMMAATVLFVTSCGEDVENPIGGDGITLTSSSRTIETDGVVAAPGQTFRVNVAAGTSAVTAATDNAAVVDVNGAASATNDSIEFTVKTGATLGQTATLTFTTTGGESEQLTVTVGYENIADVVTFTEGFSILGQALLEQTLTYLSTLATEAPVTVFAPTDDAFQKCRV